MSLTPIEIKKMEKYYLRTKIKETYSENSDQEKISQVYDQPSLISETLMRSAVRDLAFEMKTVFIKDKTEKLVSMHHYPNPNHN